MPAGGDRIRVYRRIEDAGSVLRRTRPGRPWYNQGRMDPHSTSKAADPGVNFSTTDQLAYDDIAKRILQMGRLAAARLDADAIRRFQQDIDRQRALMGDQPYYREWSDIIRRGSSAIAAILLDESERGRYLRAVVPLRAFVSRAERDWIFERHRVPEELQRHFA